jgi:hypothetical protein
VQVPKQPSWCDCLQCALARLVCHRFLFCCQVPVVGQLLRSCKVMCGVWLEGLQCQCLNTAAAGCMQLGAVWLQVQSGWVIARVVCAVGQLVWRHPQERAAVTSSGREN